MSVYCAAAVNISKTDSKGSVYCMERCLCRNKFSGIHLGLSNILKVSVPILQTIYPMAIVLIVLAFLHPWIAKWRFVYPVTILMTGLTSVFYILGTLGVKMGVITTVLKSLPLYKEQLVWIIPAIFGLAVGILSSILLPKRGRK